MCAKRPRWSTINSGKYRHLLSNLNEWVKKSKFIAILFFYFSGKLCKTLNTERQIAAKNIVLSLNKPLPYCLDGPAGKINLFFLLTISSNLFLSKELERREHWWLPLRRLYVQQTNSFWCAPIPTMHVTKLQNAFRMPYSQNWQIVFAPHKNLSS